MQHCHYFAKNSKDLLLLGNASPGFCGQLLILTNIQSKLVKLIQLYHYICNNVEHLLYCGNAGAEFTALRQYRQICGLHWQKFPIYLPKWRQLSLSVPRSTSARAFLSRAFRGASAALLDLGAWKFRKSRVTLRQDKTSFVSVSAGMSKS